MLVAAAGVAAGFILLRDDGQKTALATLSAVETAFEMPLPETLGLPDGPKTTGEAFHLAERDGLRIVRIPQDDGASCWGTAERRSNEWQLTHHTCETGFGRFPDSESPVLVLSRGGFLSGTELLSYESFRGLAADGVQRVGVIDAQDQLVQVADVVGNAFFVDAPQDRIKAVVALDKGGEILWRSPPRQVAAE